MAKANPGKLSYASAGTGTPPQLAGELFKQSTGTFTTHVPYRGAAPALQDVMASQADMASIRASPSRTSRPARSSCWPWPATRSRRSSPTCRPMPTWASRTPSLDIWFGMWVPNNTPAEVTARLARELTKVLASPAVKQRFGDLGAEPVALDTAEFKKLLAQEGKTLSALIKDRKIIVE